MSDFWQQLSTMPNEFHIGIACFLGLMVGSFLNVVIFRFPKILHFQWTQQSYQWLYKQDYTETPPPGLIKPPSHCMQCGQAVRFWQNIPVLSYLLLRGRCAQCKTKISFRYPCIELLTGVLSAFAMYHFGWSWQAAASIFLIWNLVALTFIDFDHQLLPDDIVLPIMWLGLALSFIPIFAQTKEALLGAMFGYLSFWSIFHVFKLMTGEEGMGHGDFKLLALFGAWLGWQVLPLIILLSTAIGSVVGIGLMLSQKGKASSKMPFGPYIAIAGLIALFWGNDIIRYYLSF